MRGCADHAQQVALDGRVVIWESVSSSSADRMASCADVLCVSHCSTVSMLRQLQHSTALSSQVNTLLR
jgi:hypothetical protein